MSRTHSQQTAWEVGCYGCSEASIDASVEDWKVSPFALGNGDPKMLAFSILSDVQELIELGRKEDARKKINVVKHILHQHVKNVGY